MFENLKSLEADGPTLTLVGQIAIRLDLVRAIDFVVTGSIEDSATVMWIDNEAGDFSLYAEDARALFALLGGVVPQPAA